MNGQPLPRADAAWLHMDRPTNPMVVNSLIWFGEQVEWERTRDLLQRRIVDEFPRFRRRVSDPPGRSPRFEDYPDFDVDQHLHRIALPAPGDQAALQELVGDLISWPIDGSRALWQAYLIDGYGPGSAILFRIHHCIADGTALARVMLTLTDEEVDAAIAAGPAAEDGQGRGLLDALLRPAGRAISIGRRGAKAAVHEGMESLADPGHAIRLGAAAGRDAATLAKLLTAPSDSPTVLKSPLHGTRRAAWSTPFPLDRVKRAGRRSGATINDMLVAAVTGALHTYLAERNSATEELLV